MKFKTDAVKMLQLSRKETVILGVLSNGSLRTVAEISRNAKLPRMTLYSILATLKERGLIDYVRKGKRKYWSAISSEQFGQKLSMLGYEVAGNKKMRLAVQDHTGFTIIHGKEALFNVWKELTETNPGKRIRAIQPTKSLLSAIKSYSPGEFVPINEMIKKNKIIMESLVREDVFPAYINFYKGMPNIQKEILESFIGRSTDTVFTSNEYLNNNSDLLITHDAAVLMNWQYQVAIKIENKEMVSLLNELFQLARGYGKKIDQNEYLRRLRQAMEEGASVVSK
jgi:DNA-binding transcriptional ArsR family regulator